MTPADAGDGESRIQIQITTNPQPPATKYARVRYTVTCTPPAKGTLQINKASIGGTDTFSIDATPAIGPAINYSIPTVGAPNGNGSESKQVDPGTYTISETPPSGWILDSIQCGNGPAGQTAQATVVANQPTTCTVTNRKKASVTIKKQTINGTGAFDFDATTVPAGQGAIAQFTQSTAVNNPSLGQVLSDLVPGTYTFTETPPGGATWLLTDLNCTGTGVSAVSTNGLAGTFTLAPGANATCTYENTKQDRRLGTIIIQKVAAGGDGATPFSFTTTGTGLSGFSLTPPANGPAPIPETFTNLQPGAYSVTETPVPGWTTTVACVDPTGNSTQAGTNVANIDVAAGETVTCTFTNKRQTGSLKVKKVTIGGDGTFAFTATGQPGFNLKNGDTQSFSGLAPGQYTVKEVNLPAGWKLQNVSCTGGGNKQGNGITVDIAGNETVTCTFTNFKQKDERMEEVTKVFINRRVDNLLTHGPDRARMLRRLQPGEPPVSLKDAPPLKLGQSPQAAPGATNFADPFARQSQGLFATEEDDEQPWNRQSASTSPLLSSISSQLSGLGGNGAGGSQSFKFGTSLSEVREAAIAAEAERQKANLAAAGLSFTGQPYVNPYTTMRPGFDLWIEGHVSRYSDGTGGIGRDGTFKLLYVGADYAIAPGILVGALVQIDDTREDVDSVGLAGEVEGTGWMAGPYVGIRLLDNLFLDARAAWGTSSNDIWLADAVAGRRSGSFDTDRWLASANLTGNYQYGAWRLSPQLGIAYGSEAYDTYFNSLGQAVEGSRASIGRLTGGAEVGYRFLLDSGAILEPHVSLTGIWNFDTDDVRIGGVLVQSDETRARIEGGLIYRTPMGFAMRGAVAYDGIGGDDFEAVSGQLWVSVPLN
ncbi:MAG: autotransporter domain-containing protein [Pseudomonadota bacterium]